MAWLMQRIGRCCAALPTLSRHFRNLKKRNRALLHWQLVWLMVAATLLVMFLAFHWWAASTLGVHVHHPRVRVVRPSPGTLCHPHHGVISTAISADSLVFCIHEPYQNDLYVSKTIATRGYWPDCIDVMRLLLLFGNSDPRNATQLGLQRLFVDVGANIGACTALVAKHMLSSASNNSLARIIAVEPLNRNVIILNATIQANPWMKGSVTVVEAAALDDPDCESEWKGKDAATRGTLDCLPSKQRYVTLTSRATNAGNTSIDRIMYRDHPVRGQQQHTSSSNSDVAVVVTIDQIVDQHQIVVQHMTTAGVSDVLVSLLKIDVQGSEAQVLRGAKKLLADRRVEMIMLEVEPHPHSVRSIEQCTESLAILFSHNFCVYYRVARRIELVNKTIGSTFIARGFWEMKLFQEMRLTDVDDYIQRRLHDDANSNTSASDQDRVLASDVVALSSEFVARYTHVVDTDGGDCQSMVPVFNALPDHAVVKLLRKR